MKKIIAILLAALICGTILAGCGKSSSENQKQDFTVYSFSGENEQLKISNGVIVITSAEDVFYGGDLEVNLEDLSDIVAYSTDFYIVSSDKKTTLMSDRVEDMTGGTIHISLNTGRIIGDIISETRIDELQNNLYFKLQTTNLDGEDSEYHLQLTLTEVTEKAGG